MAAARLFAIDKESYGDILSALSLDWLLECEAEFRVKKALSGPMPGQSSVFEAYLADGTPAVLKVFKVPTEMTERLTLPFRREMAGLQALADTSRVVKILKVISAPQPALLLEWVPGGSLNSRLHDTSKPCMTPAEKLTVLRDVAEALEHAHAKNIVHRDVKSLNIVLEADGRAKLIDFGIMGYVSGQVRDHEIQRTSAGGMSTLAGGGTLMWMAPELVEDRAAKHHKTPLDVYAFGMVALELLLDSEGLFRGVSPAKIEERILAGKVADIRPAWRAEMPDIVSIFEKCTALDAADRPSIADVKRFLNGDKGAIVSRRPLVDDLVVPSRTADPILEAYCTACSDRPEGYGRILLPFLLGDSLMEDDEGEVTVRTPPRPRARKEKAAKTPGSVERVIHEGPRGGKFWMDERGIKHYVSRDTPALGAHRSRPASRDITVRHEATKHPMGYVVEGPRGGRYYETATGKKKYVSRDTPLGLHTAHSSGAAAGGGGRGSSAAGGRVLHVGPKGGVYYVTSGGNKSYVKKC